MAAATAAIAAAVVWTSRLLGRTSCSRARGSRRPAAGGGTVPLTKDRLQIQTEGAEVFYRNIALRPVTEFPKAYKP